MNQKITTGTFAALGMLLLILDAKTALAGATQGITMCLQAVIPSLFPFFVLSVILTASLSGVSTPLLRPVGKLCAMPSGSEVILATGFLGGYPVGAQSIRQACENGQLSKDDAHRLLGFCSNAGPAFIFGIIGRYFQVPLAAWVIWLIHILSAISVGILLPSHGTDKADIVVGKPVTLTDAIARSIRITANVCAWIILFRIVIAFLNRWLFWLLPVSVSVILSGILELANGCCELGSISSQPLRFVIACSMLAFGGLSITMQTISVTGKLGLGLYLHGKALQTAISMLLALMLCPVLFGITIVPAALCIALLAMILFAGFLLRKKGIAFPGKIVYN